MAVTRTEKIVIVGGGFGGITAAIELQKHGFRDLTLLERAPALGGTWFHNSYPGAACDVPSHLYSLSFARRRNWSRLCGPQQEILDYLREVAGEHGIERLVETDTEVTRCVWDRGCCRWTIESADGRSWQADAVIIATGQLHREAYPQIEGLEDFAGHSFHSAKWDHDYELRGKRVGVIGTGASAVQFVPEIAEEVSELVVFQRTGNWFLPRENRPYSRLFRTLLAIVPGAQAVYRWCIYHYTEALTLMIRHPRTIGRLGRARSAAFMRSQLKDPQLRERVWPDYTFGCKRILFSSQFLATLERPNVRVVTEQITRMTPRGPSTADGNVHELDCLIYASGFRTNDFMFPMEIVGSDQRRLRDVWAHGAHAHLGVTIPGFPSLFLMYGPNTNTSGGSILIYLEAQASYLRQALSLLRSSGAGAIDVRPEVEEQSNSELQKRFDGTAWTSCDSWYRDETGRIVTNWPGYMREYVKRTRTLDPDEYVLLNPVAAPSPVAA
ncbi:MAG TPA: NAD(P)/FAD-dependent oxidoreductase [Solirubrobacteraceae bacterium]